MNDLREQYRALNDLNPVAKPITAINSDCLIVLPSTPDGIDPDNVGMAITSITEEFTAACPLSGLPDYGKLTIEYIPGDVVLELKSLKYYLNSFAGVGIAQEHAAALIAETLKDKLDAGVGVELQYMTRGGIQTMVRANC